MLAVAAALAATAASPDIEASASTVRKIIGHLKHFETAAKANENSRSILKGYNASAEYVMAQLRTQSGLKVSTQHYTVPVWTEVEPPRLTVLGADPSISLSRCDTRTGWQHYMTGCDYSGVRYGGNGTYDLTATVTHVDAPCDAQSFSSFPSGHIALLDVVAGCDYYTMTMNAQRAGASALIIASAAGSVGVPGSRAFESNSWTPDTPLLQIPAVGVTAAVGAVLRQRTYAVALGVNARYDIAHTYNVFAETVDGDADDVVMVGAHLDSVPEGPGINDNGSGSAMVLQLALDAARRRRRRRRLRFAWWGAEEIGLMGSYYYVDNLVRNHPEELARISAYLNFDMEAGPNYIRMVYDGATAPEPARDGSVRLQKLFEQAWTAEGLSFGPTPMGGGSDFLPFILAGVPASGLATGAGGVKSEDERAEHGGLANAPLDPCYHAPCDTVANVSPQCLRDCDAALRSVLAALETGYSVPRQPPLPRGAVADRFHSAAKGASRGFHMSCDSRDEL